MLSIEEIKKQYPSDIHRFERGLLREYLQFLILEIIFNSNISTKLSFLGGTCLRIVHGIKRFSEDLDFDNKELSSKEFTSLAKKIEQELQRHGFDVEIKVTEKKAIHCHVKFSNILFENKLSDIETEKTSLQKEVKKIVTMAFIIAVALCLAIVIVYGIINQNWIQGLLS